MHSAGKRDLEAPDQPFAKKIKRAVRRPKAVAPAKEEVRGWAKSAIKSRNKS